MSDYGLSAAQVGHVTDVEPHGLGASIPRHILAEAEAVERRSRERVRIEFGGRRNRETFPVETPSTRFRGVHWDSSKREFVAKLYLPGEGRSIRCCSGEDEELVARLWDAAAVDRLGLTGELLNCPSRPLPGVRVRWASAEGR